MAQETAVPAPEQPGPPRSARGRWTARAVVALVFALAGVLFAASALTAHGTDLRAGRAVGSRDLVAKLAQELAVRQAAVDALTREVGDLSARSGGAALAVEQRRVARLAPAAGLTPVVGPGVRVTLEDAPRGRIGQNPPGNPDPNDLVVHQQDVQAVVNALWRGGASAVQVMDQRLIATSAVRCVGNTLILQGRVYSPPFTVSAVGDPAGLQRSLDADAGVSLFREYVDLYGLGYAVRTEQSMTIPAYSGSIELQHASPVSPVGGTPSPSSTRGPVSPTPTASRS